MEALHFEKQAVSHLFRKAESLAKQDGPLTPETYHYVISESLKNWLGKQPWSWADGSPPPRPWRCGQSLTQYCRRLAQVLRHLDHDWKLLCRFAEHDPGPLQRLDCQGDPHDGGQMVMSAVFQTRWRVLMKPRSLQADFCFQNLLDILQDSKGDENLRTPRVIQRPGANWGWVEFIPSASQEPRPLRTRFLRQAGGLLSLLECLQTIDCHVENILVDRLGNALPIDLECLFHPRLPSPKSAATKAEILQVTLLPWPGSRRAFGELSSLGGRVRTPEDLQEVTAGYEQMVRLLLQKRQHLLSENGWLEQSRNVPVRVVLRSTVTYAELLRKLDSQPSPRQAREFAARYLQKLSAGKPHLARVIPHEVDSLVAGDIPRFFSPRADSRELRIGRNSLPDCWETPGWNAARDRLQALSENDLQEKLQMIRSCWKELSNSPAA